LSIVDCGLLICSASLARPAPNDQSSINNEQAAIVNLQSSLDNEQAAIVPRQSSID
jgi:hypothetical protein